MSGHRTKLPSSHYQFSLGWEIFYFFNNPSLHDVVLHTDVTLFSISRGTLSAGRFYAHKDVLCGRSELFFNLMCGGNGGEEEGDMVTEVTEGDVHVKIERYVQESELDSMLVDDEEGDLEEDKEDSPSVRHYYVSASSDALELVLRYLYKGAFDLNVILPKDQDDVQEKYYKYLKVDLLPQVMALCKLFKLDSLYLWLKKRLDKDISKISMAVNEGMKFSAKTLESTGNLTLQIGNAVFEKQSSVLLSARSTFFSSILNGLWNEAENNTLTLGMVPASSMSKILQFINYDGDIILENLQEILDVLQWAFYFGVNSLINFCEHLLDVEYLNEETVCPIWNLVSSHAETEFLAQKCEAYLQEFFLKCARTNGFLALRQDLLKGILDAGKINAESLEMMCAIKKWADARAMNSSHAKDLFFQMLPPHTMFNTYNRMVLLGVVDPATMTGIPRSMLFSIS